MSDSPSTGVPLPGSTPLFLGDEAAFRREFFERARDGIVILSADGTVREVNEAFAAMLGCSRAEVRQMRVWDWDVQWSREEILQRIAGLSAASATFETRHRRRDGSEYDVEISANGARHGDELLLYCVHRDITERKRAGENLRESQERFAAIFHGTTNALAFTEPDRGLIVDVNEAWSTILGVPRERAVGMTARDLGLWALPAERELCVEQLRVAGRLRDFEVLLATANGQRQFLASADKVVIRDVEYVLWEFRDIELLRQAQREQEQLRRQLFQAQKMEAVGQLAGGIAHDFNNLLQVIIGRSEIVTGLLPPGDPSLRHMTELTAAARRAAALVGQILAYSRRQVMRPEPLDLNEVVAGVLAMLEQVFGERITVSFEPGPGLHALRADRAMIEQLLVNLGMNARDAMGLEGRLAVSTRNVVVGEDLIAMDERAKPGRYVLLTFADTGCGMDVSTQARIFEPFFTTKDVGKGTGLGLSVVYGVVRQHAGLVQVQSRPGSGSTFRVYLPAHDQGDGRAVEREARP